MIPYGDPKIENFLMHLAEVLKSRCPTEDIPDTAHPPCPECGNLMEYHCDDIRSEFGSGYWECPHCDFLVEESDLEGYL